MEIVNALKRPFSDIKNLVIGLIIMIIPLLNILVIPGYMLRVAKTAMKGDNKLPGFDNFGELVINSLKYLVVGLILAIVFGIISTILALIPAVGPALVAIWTIVTIFLMMSAVLTLAETEDIAKAIMIHEQIDKIKQVNFIIAIIVGTIISGVIISIVLGATLGAVLIPALPALMAGDMSILMSAAGLGVIGLVLTGIVGYALGIFSITLIAEEY